MTEPKILVRGLNKPRAFQERRRPGGIDVHILHMPYRDCQENNSENYFDRDGRAESDALHSPACGFFFFDSSAPLPLANVCSKWRRMRMATIWPAFWRADLAAMFSARSTPRVVSRSEYNTSPVLRSVILISRRPEQLIRLAMRAANSLTAAPLTTSATPFSACAFSSPSKMVKPASFRTMRISVSAAGSRRVIGVVVM